MIISLEKYQFQTLTNAQYNTGVSNHGSPIDKVNSTNCTVLYYVQQNETNKTEIYVQQNETNKTEINWEFKEKMA